MKKALVWFLTAALAVLPLQSAALDTTQLLVLDDYWYGGQTVESDKTGAQGARVTLDKAFYIGSYGAWEGLRVIVRQEGADAYEIAIAGDYEKVEAMSIDEGVRFERAVRIPIQISGSAPGDYVLANGSPFELVQEQGNDALAWLYLPLQKGGCTASCMIGAAGDTNRVRIRVVYEDKTYSPADDTTAYRNVSFELLAYAGAQTDHFRAQCTGSQNGVGAAYSPQAALEHTGGAQAVNHLTFQIAAMTPQDRAEIFRSASYQQDDRYYFLQGNDAMAVKLRVVSPSGEPYPAGTLIEVVNLGYGDWAELIGATGKTVTSSGSAVYYLDQDSCFTLTCPGITVFAAAAAGMHAQNWEESLGQSALDSLLAIRSAFSENFSQSMTKSEYETLLDYIGGSESFTWAYQWYVGRLGLQLTYGAQTDLAVMDLYFQNAPRFTEQQEPEQKTIDLAVGQSSALPALRPDAQTGWNSVNSQTAVVTGNASDGYAVHGISQGTTYLFCADAQGTVSILTVHVTAPEEVPENTPEPQPPQGITRYVVTASELSLRAGPNAQTTQLAVYPHNTIVSGVETPGSSWIAVYEDGQLAGYCYGAYLAELE
jgi:hypothetical protein